MIKPFIFAAFGWGIVLWIVGYLLGIVLFPFVPPGMIGWIIMPIGVLLTLWVLLKKVKGDTLQYYLFLGIVWVVLAILLDYFLLVQLFKPVDGYYKLDVYLYYIITFFLPVSIGYKKLAIKKN